MRLCTIRIEGVGEEAAIGIGSGIMPVSKINQIAGTGFPTDTLELIDINLCNQIKSVIENTGIEPVIPDNKSAQFGPPYRNPSKIWGISFNYKSRDGKTVDTAEDPVVFMKPNTTIIGNGDNIILPRQSQKVVAEAELGVIIGKRCKDLSVPEAYEAIFGFTTLFDMGALDISRANPRFMARAKSFDTFLSYGPWIISKDEIDDPDQLEVSCFLNGENVQSGMVADMIHSPAAVVAFLSGFMTLMPGDLVCAGTPGLVPIKHGDRVVCEISGIGRLINHVVAASDN